MKNPPEVRGSVAHARKRGASSRSTSSPPGFAGQAKVRSSSCSEGREGKVKPDHDCDKAENGVHEGDKANGRFDPGLSHGRNETSTKPDRLDRYLSPQATYTETELPSEDFVEGGVELYPSEGKVHEPEEATPPRPTRKLPAWGDAELEEFWKKGDGTRALFLDYDGTLREFENRPELATPTEELEALLAAINAREDLVPHIISGRDAQFLETSFAKYSRFTLIAEHGFQIWRPGSTAWELTDHPDGLDKDHDDWKVIVRKSMSAFVKKMGGSFIEEKASSLVWHYREVPDQEAAEKVAVEAIDRLERLRDREKIHKIRISNGHKVVEVSYRKVRKGPCMRRICEEKALFGEPFLSVLVAGDDVSDESMFDIAPEDFLTIKVGQAQTLASFRVETPAELRRFLWQLAS